MRNKFHCCLIEEDVINSQGILNQLQSNTNLFLEVGGLKSE